MNNKIKWLRDKLNVSDLTEDSLGYKTRLLTIEDLTNNLGYVLDVEATSPLYIMSENTPAWVNNSNYRYWTMSQYEDSASQVWHVNSIDVHYAGVNSPFGVVRPVITLSKTAI